MIPPLPPRKGDARPHITIRRSARPVTRQAAQQPTLPADATARLAILLQVNAPVSKIRDQLLAGCSYDAVRGAVLRCAATDEFAQALTDALPAALKETAEAVLVAWRDQDQRVHARERLRSLRRLVTDLDSLGATVATLRAARRTP